MKENSQSSLKKHRPGKQTATEPLRLYPLCRWHCQGGQRLGDPLKDTSQGSSRAKVKPHLPSAKSDGFGIRPHCLRLSSAIPTWLVSLSQKDFGSSLLILLHETLKTLFSPTVFSIFSIPLPKRLVPDCFLLLWLTWP